MLIILTLVELNIQIKRADKIKQQRTAITTTNIGFYFKRIEYSSFITINQMQVLLQLQAPTIKQQQQQQRQAV